MPLVATAELVRRPRRAVAAWRRSTSSRSTRRRHRRRRAGPPPGDPAAGRENTVKFHDGRIRPLAAALAALASDAEVR